MELVHHQPLTDEDDVPTKAFNSPCINGVQSISEWCGRHQNTNVYRSIKIWTDNSKRETILGPFVIDIDNDDDLDDALTVTRNAVKCIFKIYRLKDSDIQLFFTGHKGFNIEILPSALGLAGIASEWDNKVCNIREEIISELRRSAGLVSQSGQARNIVSAKGTVIDGIHDYVRLHNSINKWIETSGQKARRKIGITLKEFNSLQLKQMVDRSTV
mgnify:CR=1 FL=1